jgi:hypothetical protein
MNFAEKQCYEDGYRDCRKDILEVIQGKLDAGESLREWLHKSRQVWK